MPDIKLDLGIPLEEFLANYWQQKPLLVKNALPGFKPTLAADELAALACEELSSSRIIEQEGQQWRLRQGPFSEKDFLALPEEGWTLLVCDVDKWHLATERLLNAFRFLPDWRLDDVMISYGTDQSSVGPHVDQYDVFLIQAEGNKLWQIAEAGSGRKMEHPDINLLEGFEPAQTWLLEPGDLLYLPPGIPHHGIAQGNCMTYSVGMRAPSEAELLSGLADYLLDKADETSRFTDAGRSLSVSPSVISEEDIRHIRTCLNQAISHNDHDLADWFGRFITRYRLAFEPVAGSRIAIDDLLNHQKEGGSLFRSPWGRYISSGPILYACGDAYDCGAENTARQLSGSRCLENGQLGQLLDSEQLKTLILDLVNNGHWTLEELTSDDE